MSSNEQGQAYYSKGFSKAVSDTHNWRTVENAVPFIIPYLKKDQKLLDVGCGPGLILKDLANYVDEVVGIETGKELVEIARNQCDNPNVTFEQATAYDLPFDDNSFDVVFASQVIIHLEDPVKGLKEMARVCKPGGFVCVKDADLELFTIYPEQYAPAIKEAYFARSPSTTSRIAGRELKANALKAGYGNDDIRYTTSTWSAGDHPGRKWWSDMYIGRLRNLNELDHEKDKQMINVAIKAWEQWTEDNEGVVILNHGEIVYKKPSA